MTRTPNPFENPELFQVPAPITRPATSEDMFASPQPSPASPPPVSPPPTDPKVERLTAQVEALTSSMNQVIRHLRSKQADDGTGPKRMAPETTPPRVDTTGGRPRRKPYTVRIPKLSLANWFPYLQVLAFLGLTAAVVFLLFRGHGPDDSGQNEVRAAYQRSVTALKLGSETLSTELMTIANDIRKTSDSDTPLTKQQLDGRLTTAIKNAMLAAGEGPMKALDSIDPWDAKIVAERLESSADAFSDAAKALERLK